MRFQKDILMAIGAAVAVLTLAALTLWALWHFAVLLTPFVRAFFA